MTLAGKSLMTSKYISKHPLLRAMLPPKLVSVYNMKPAANDNDIELCTNRAKCTEGILSFLPAVNDNELCYVPIN